MVPVGQCPRVNVVTKGRRGQNGTWGSLDQPLPAHHCNTISNTTASRPRRMAIPALSSGGGSEEQRAHTAIQSTGRLHHDHPTPSENPQGLPGSVLAPPQCHWHP